MTIANTSDIGGKEAVQLYIRGYGNSIRRRGKELKGFEKVYLRPHEEKVIEFTLGYEELKIYSAAGKYEVEAGKVEIMVGSNPNLPLKAAINTLSQIIEK